jgi:GntR family transcriptional regulator, transcriptional repressor for pyruvate dehydrogenase complex
MVAGGVFMEQVVKTNISEAIVRQMVDRIARGEHKPGEKLPPERELMQLLGVGRSSIREAFQALALMGLIDIRPGQGTFVRAVTSETVIHPSIFAPLVDPEVTAELLEARRAFEPVAAELAAQRCTESDLAALESVLRQCREALENGEPVYSLSAGFHLLIARASHNTVFVRFMESIVNLMAARGANIEEHYDFVLWELESHRRVLESVASKNPDLAREAMLEHLESSADFYRELSSAPDAHSTVKGGS